MTKDEIEKARKNLQSRFPLLGHSIRMAAVQKLAADLTPDAIQHLASAISSFDPEVAQTALQALGDIKHQKSIDELSRIWFGGRDKPIENIIASSKYVASKPLEIHVATALKTGKTELCDTAPSVEFLVKFLSDKDDAISQNAGKTLRSLKNQDAIDSLCQTWFGKRDSQLDEFVSSSKYVAEKPFEIHVATALKSGKTELCDTAPSVEFLLKFLSDKDAVISQNATKALRSLKNQDAIDSLCQFWYGKKDRPLDEIVLSSKYVAAKPLEIRVATALKLGKTELCDTAPSVEFLVKFLSDKDATISQNAAKALRSLNNQEAIDSLCQIWFGKRDSQLDEFVSSSKYVGAKPLEIRVATALKTCKTELCDTAPSVEFLLKFLSDKDATISLNAAKSLQSLKNQNAIDSLCQTWYGKRDSQLDVFVSSSKYVAAKPLEIRVATALKLGKNELCDNAPSVEFLVKFLSDKDAIISLNAAKFLQRLKNQNAIDSLCQTWYNKRDNQLDEFVSFSKYVAAKPLEIRVATALKAGKTELFANVPPVEFLVKFLSDKDAAINQNAAKALRSLKYQDAIDSLCQIWFEKRDRQMDEIVTSSKYVASKPLEIRIATALKAGKTELCDNATAVELLVKFLSDKDAVISQNAEKALHNLKSKNTIDFICENLIDGKMEILKSISIEKNYHPTNVSRRSLFFVLTGQIEKYFDLDYEFQYLRAEYQAAPEEMQQRIRSIIQKSGDHRLMGLFGEVRKKIVAKDLTEHEVDVMLDVYKRNRQTEEIFALLFFAPVIALPRIIDVLEQEKWQPQDDGQKNVWDELLKARKRLGKNITRPDEPEVVLGSVFAKWMDIGKTEYATKSVEEIRKILKDGDPPEAVSALSALVYKNLLTPADQQFVSKHPHWMVRMAYMGLAGTQSHILLKEHPVDLSGGGEYWLKQSPAIANSEFLNLRAAGINPEQLQQLSDALQKQQGTAHHMVPWAMLLNLLSAYTLRNTIVIGAYQKHIEDTAISI